MTTESTTPGLTIGQLEAKYPMYCKAMRLLLREGCTLKQIQRTVCWDRLEILHNSLPKSYKSPEYLFLLFRREWEQHKASLAGDHSVTTAHLRPPHPLRSKQRTGSRTGASAMTPAQD